MEWAENVTGMVDAKERGEIQGQCEDITMTLKNQDMMVCGSAWGTAPRLAIAVMGLRVR